MMLPESQVWLPVIDPPMSVCKTGLFSFITGGKYPIDCDVLKYVLATFAVDHTKVRLPTIGDKRSCMVNTMALVILMHLGFPFLAPLYHCQIVKAKEKLGRSTSLAPSDFLFRIEQTIGAMTKTTFKIGR